MKNQKPIFPALGLWIVEGMSSNFKEFLGICVAVLMGIPYGATLTNYL